MGGGCSNTTIGTYHMSMCECDFHDVYSKSSSMSLNSSNNTIVKLSIFKWSVAKFSKIAYQ